MVMKTCFCEVFHYSNIEVFGDNKTIQEWQLAWLDTLTQASLISSHYCTMVVIANQGIQVGH